MYYIEGNFGNLWFFLGILIKLVIVYIKGISLGIFDASGVPFFRNFDRFLVIVCYIKGNLTKSLMVWWNWFLGILKILGLVGRIIIGWSSHCYIILKGSLGIFDASGVPWFFRNFYWSCHLHVYIKGITLEIFDASRVPLFFNI